MKPFNIIMIAAALGLGGCNSVYLKPGSMEPGVKVHAVAGGYSMKRSVKESLENRGYEITVGKNRRLKDGDGISTDSYELPSDVKYVVKVDERREKFNSFWCVFNGFWWWNFNISIADQKTGEEILTWRGRGCAHSSVRKLNDILDRLEGKK